MSLTRAVVTAAAILAVVLFALFAVWMFGTLSDLGPVTSPG